LRIIAGIALGALLAGLALNACSPHRDRLERIKAAGVIHVLTRESATTYYEGPLGPTGLEYDLAKRFAKYLGVKLKLETPNTFEDILKRIRNGDADMAAAGLTVTKARQKKVRFGPPYQYITQQLVFRLGTPAPRDLDHLTGPVEVVAGSSHAERLRQLKQKHPKLEWVANRKASTEELLTLVWQQVVDYTVADSNEVAINRRYYPSLRVGFDLSKPQALAWAFPRDGDESLYKAAVKFFDQLKSSGELDALLDRYYGHVEDYDYAGTKTYMRHVRMRLPDYRPEFQDAAREYHLDWRLLAAMAYQESHWDPDAVSPTGVRGIMMLTIATARHLGVDKRTDPIQSIQGGAQYLRRLLDELPDSIKEPDRTWFALAAYNVGLGHVEDARAITRKRGGDPNLWADVKESLPLLRRRKWYRHTRHGYARGNEPVRYVENIRSYYDILTWMLDRDEPEPGPERALAVDSPVL